MSVKYLGLTSISIKLLLSQFFSRLERTWRIVITLVLTVEPPWKGSDIFDPEIRREIKSLAKVLDK